MVFHADFAIGTARFMGNHHLAQRRNCQDYPTFRIDGHSMVVAVGDGCGSNEFSEVGCTVGIEMLVTIVQSLLATQRAHELDWRAVKQQYLEAVKKVAAIMCGSDALVGDFVRQFFLHTAVLALLDDEMLYIMRFGDGYAGINGDIVTRNDDVYKDTGPPFLANELLTGVDLEKVFTEAEREFELVALRPIDQVETFFVGTDGLRFWPAATDATLPGREQIVGPLTTLMNPEYANKPPLLQQLVRLMGTPYPPPRPGVMTKTSPGYFGDDVAVAVGARRI